MKTVKSIISQIIIIGILLVIIFTDYLNPIKEYVPVFWSIVIIWSIFHSIKYRKGNVKNELRFLTNNDDYNKIYPFIIGILLLIGGICSIVLINEYLIFTSLMTLNGLLLIISGILFIPNGIIWIKNNELNSVSGNKKNKISIEKLSEICLFQDKIIFTDETEKTHSLDHLNLKQSDYSKISDFLNRNLKNKIEIKTYGNTV